MRVLYFSRDYSAHDHRFLSALAETDHEIFSLRLEKRGPQREDRGLPARVHQVVWNGGREPVRRREYKQYSRKLKQIIEEIQPDLVHAGSVQTAALVTAMSGFEPLVTMSWGYDLLLDADSTPQMKRDTQFTLKRTASLVCDCQAVADKAQSYGFDTTRIVKFPWGVDLEHFHPGGRSIDREQLEWPADAFILLSLRAWEPLYDVQTIVRGFIDAAAQAPDLRLVLLGGGSQANQLRQMLINAGMMEKVHFGGRVGYNELPRYYRAADLYLSASLTDGSSVSLMESLACGTPALLSEIPGNEEWIDQETGWFFPVGDWKTLSLKLVQAAQQRTQVNGSMRDKARELAERRADWRKNFPALMDAYQIALENTHGI